MLETGVGVLWSGAPVSWRVTMGRISTMSPRQSDPLSALPLKPKPLRLALYVLTALSTAAALFLEPALDAAAARGAISSVWLFTGAAVYGVFFLAYAVDRLLLVMRRRYPAGRAFFQVAFALVFGLLLLPSSVRDYANRAPHGIERLLAHPDAEVRATAVEAIGFRGPSREHIALVIGKLKDPNSRVERAAREVLARWSGRSPGDTAGINAWASALSNTATVGAPGTTGEETR